MNILFPSDEDMEKALGESHNPEEVILRTFFQGKFAKYCIVLYCTVIGLVDSSMVYSLDIQILALSFFYKWRGFSF